MINPFADPEEFDRMTEAATQGGEAWATYVATLETKKEGGQA